MDRGAADPTVDLRTRVLRALSSGRATTALALSRDLDCQKALVQRCLYQLSSQGKARKEDEKHWRLTEAGVAEAQEGVAEAQEGVAEAQEGEVDGGGERALVVVDPTVDLRTRVLRALSSGRATTALALSRDLNCQKAPVQRCLYQLSSQGRARKEGEKSWRLTEAGEVDGDHGEVWRAGAVATWGEARRGSSETGKPPQQVTNITYVLGDQYSTIQQYGAGPNSFSNHIQGTSYVQVGSENTVRGTEGRTPRRRDAGDYARPAGPGTSARDRGGEPAWWDGGGNVEIITEELVGLQIGNGNVLVNQAAPSDSED